MERKPLTVTHSPGPNLPLEPQAFLLGPPLAPKSKSRRGPEDHRPAEAAAGAGPGRCLVAFSVSEGRPRPSWEKSELLLWLQISCSERSGAPGSHFAAPGTCRPARLLRVLGVVGA